MDSLELLKNSYSGIFEIELIKEIAEVANIKSFKENEVLIDFGNYIKSIPLLLSGAIRVMREDRDEGELLLYFLEKGDTCAMSLACCVGHKKSEIRAIAENDVQVAMIPASKMEEWMSKYHSWRIFVLESHSNRFNELLNALDSLAFKHMDERLYDYLLESSQINNSKIINKTHQEIAYTLNTSRVVISRLLKALENEGKIKLNRNQIIINE